LPPGQQGIGMFQAASPAVMRKLALASALGLALICAIAGGAAWQLTRCDVLNYLNRAATSPLNPRERYLFACGYLWRSRDGGQVWTRTAAQGLPFGARDGHIAIDRKPGFLYLGVLINSRSSIYCLHCAWTNLRPAIYTSADGGQHWSFAYKFRYGPAGQGGFLGLFGDPDLEGRAWAVIQNIDAITYYGTGTAGKFWTQNCLEYYFTGAGGCHLPKNVLQFQHNPDRSGGATGQ